MPHNLHQIWRSVLLPLQLTIVLVLITLSITPNQSSNLLVHANEPFMYGFDSDKPAFNAPKGANLVTGPWIKDVWSQGNTDFLTQFNLPQNSNNTPYLYLYTLAEMAKSKGGLTDCNIYNSANPNQDLCTQGSEFLTNHFWDDSEDGILNNYRSIAKTIRDIHGNKPVFIHFEPDFYQYFTNWKDQGNKQNVKIDYKLGRNYAKPMIDILKYYLPNAKIVMDVSPWTDDLAGWTDQFKDITDYVGLVGKEFKGNDYSIDLDRNYKTISQLTGKKIIVNASQSGGGYLPLDYSWTCESTRARQADGVAGLILHTSENEKGYYENLIKSC